MNVLRFHWALDNDPGGNVAHIAQHGLTKEDVENAVFVAVKWSYSRSSGLPILFGPDLAGDEIAVVFQWASEERDELTPITAYHTGR